MDNSLEVKMRMRWPWWIVFAACFVWLMLKAPTLEAYLSNTDHGGQLCFGRQILPGKTPGIDLCMHYGALPGLHHRFGPLAVRIADRRNGALRWATRPRSR